MASWKQFYHLHNTLESELEKLLNKDDLTNDDIRATRDMLEQMESNYKQAMQNPPTNNLDGDIKNAMETDIEDLRERILTQNDRKVAKKMDPNNSPSSDEINTMLISQTSDDSQSEDGMDAETFTRKSASKHVTPTSDEGADDPTNVDQMVIMALKACDETIQIWNNKPPLIGGQETIYGELCDKMPTMLQNYEAMQRLIEALVKIQINEEWWKNDQVVIGELLKANGHCGFIMYNLVQSIQTKLLTKICDHKTITDEDRNDFQTILRSLIQKFKASIATFSIMYKLYNKQEIAKKQDQENYQEGHAKHDIENIELWDKNANQEKRKRIGELLKPTIQKINEFYGRDIFDVKTIYGSNIIAHFTTIPFQLVSRMKMMLEQWKELPPETKQQQFKTWKQMETDVASNMATDDSYQSQRSDLDSDSSDDHAEVRPVRPALLQNPTSKVRTAAPSEVDAPPSSQPKPDSTSSTEPAQATEQTQATGQGEKKSKPKWWTQIRNLMYRQRDQNAPREVELKEIGGERISSAAPENASSALSSNEEDHESGGGSKEPQMKQEFLKLKQDFEQMQSEAKTYQQKVNDYMADEKRVKEGYQKGIDMRQADLERERHLVGQLTAKLDAVKEERDKLEKYLEIAELQVTDTGITANDTKTKLENELQKILTQKAGIENQLTVVQAELDNKQRDLAFEKTQFQTAKNQITEHIEQNQNLKTKLKELQTQIAAKDRDIQVRSARSAKMKKQAEIHKQIITGQKRKLDELKKTPPMHTDDVVAADMFDDEERDTCNAERDVLDRKFDREIKEAQRNHPDDARFRDPGYNTWCFASNDSLSALVQDLSLKFSEKVTLGVVDNQVEDNLCFDDTKDWDDQAYLKDIEMPLHVFNVPKPESLYKLYATILEQLETCTQKGAKVIVLETYGIGVWDFDNVIRTYARIVSNYIRDHRMDFWVVVLRVPTERAVYRLNRALPAVYLTTRFHRQFVRKRRRRALFPVRTWMNQSTRDALKIIFAH